MKCWWCGKGPIEGVSVYRQNQKGQKGVWACSVHNAVELPEDVKTITEAVEGKLQSLTKRERGEG